MTGIRKAGSIWETLKGVAEAALISDIALKYQGTGGYRLYRNIPELFQDALVELKEEGILPSPMAIRRVVKDQLIRSKTMSDDELGVRIDSLGLTLPEWHAEQRRLEAEIEQRSRARAFNRKTSSGAVDPYADTPF